MAGESFLGDLIGEESALQDNETFGVLFVVSCEQIAALLEVDDVVHKKLHGLMDDQVARNASARCIGLDLVSNSETVRMSSMLTSGPLLDVLA